MKKLRNQLDYIHLHILSVVSLGQLQRMFSQRHNFDLRRMLEGTDAILACLIKQMQQDFAMMTNSLQPVRMNQTEREEIGKQLVPSSKQNKVQTCLTAKEN